MKNSSKSKFNPGKQQNVNKKSRMRNQTKKNVSIKKNISKKNMYKYEIIILLQKLKDYNINIVYNNNLIINLYILKNSLDIIHNTTDLCRILHYYITDPKEKWIDCENECKILSENKIKYEINSTVFYLQMLNSILISNKENYSIQFKIHNELTGLWNDDYKNIEMFIINSNGKIDNGTKPKNKTRLIMGFGPSASGKSFNTFRIIELMTLIEKDFPSYFLSIDGGIFREKSHIYQTILNCKNNNIYGYSNLVKPDPKQGLFDASYVKENIVTYLNYLKSERNFKISLYIPETLPSCDEKTCISKYDKYIKLTDDQNWIGILIYQHKTPEDCEFKSDIRYTCIGTTVSGERRQLMEGKKYSSAEWDKSYTNGYREMMKALNYRFKLHNTGKKDRINMFYDYSRVRLNTLGIFDKKINPFFIKNKWIYTEDEKNSI
jgi:hypothetical protein